jgi:hypothetical protein
MRALDPAWPNGGMSERFPPPPRRRANPWRVVAIVLAVVLAVGGLALVGMFLLFVSAMNSYGSNK